MLLDYEYFYLLSNHHIDCLVLIIFYATIQGLFPLVEAVLRSYVYVSQNLASLGTSVGLLNAFILNGNISFGNIPQDSTGQFQSNGFVNDLLLKWNTCNMCIITETIANTIKLNIDEVAQVHLFITDYFLCRL